jgi:hypothetical protein
LQDVLRLLVGVVVLPAAVAWLAEHATVLVAVGQLGGDGFGDDVVDRECFDGAAAFAER